jgi:hypothetical protein
MAKSTWTLKRARGLLRIFANEVAPDKIQDLTLEDIIHLAIGDTVEALGEAVYNEYGTKTTVTQANDVIDLSAIKYDSITKLVDETNGLCIEENNIAFEGVSGIDQKKKNIFWTKIGSNIYLSKGSEVSAYGTLSLYYNAVPTRADEDTEYLDIPEKFVDLALTKAKIRVYEITNQVPPESLTNALSNQIQQIRKTNADELQLVKGSKSKNS